ncbi:TonB-dependent receptor [Methylobacillus caricis]|uniref:TonB-dependent receptor domain-containing protein n=1 Tax=Methylobacillus caricis TaxID=1971611 RepID=UPI001CFF8A32|nr:TonB-dependent receptor [Methylobacillus caricis]MCB5187653.1 TonB-dependent receptor [Methylobacillus caricis]
MAITSMIPLPLIAAETAESNQNQDEPTTTRPTSKQSPATTILPDISVSSSRIKQERINKTQSITTITQQDLERTQASNVFDVVRGTPGVSIDGGPRLNGMSFNIRGYTDEDVAISVDGVLKNYDKYRSKGTYIEPDLLKSIEIRRGPQINSNSGYLGGAVITTTKDAEDFLRPGQKVGSRIKFSYGNNNDEYLRSYLAYARPNEHVDLLYNYSNRQSNNITQGNGDKLEFSNVGTVSELFKITLYPIESLKISTSLAKLEQSPTRQRFDTTTNIDFTPPYVMRAIDEETISQVITFTPDNPLINLRTSIGTGHTKQDESLPSGWVGNNLISSFPTLYCDGYTLRNRATNASQPATMAATLCPGDRLDAYNFKNTNFDLANTARLYQDDKIKLSLLIGIQYAKQKRELARSYGNANSLFASAAQEPASGAQTNTAFYIQPSLTLDRLSITPGYRKDFVKIEAIDASRDGLDIANQAHKVNLKEEIFSLGLAFEIIPESLTVFSNYGQGFRPVPLSTIFANSGRYNSTFWGDKYGKLNSQSLCPQDFSSCDDVYQMQRVENTEAGLTYTTPKLFGSDISITSKATFYHSHTSNSVLGTATVAGTSKITPIYGTQIRNGWEFENNLNYKMLFAQASYSRIAGKIIYPNVDSSGPIYTIPGNTFNVILGANLGRELDININYRRVSDKLYLNDVPGPNARFGTQDGYEIFNAGIRWSPNTHLTFRLIGENLGNKEYNLDGGFAGDLGLPGPGRNIKFYTELIY